MHYLCNLFSFLSQTEGYLSINRPTFDNRQPTTKLTFLKKNYFYFLLPLTAVLAWFSSPGFIFGDEYVYAKNTVDLAQGTFVNTGHHFDNRFGLLLPGVLFVKIFGTHYSVFFLFPWLCFAVLLWQVRRFLARKNQDWADYTVLLLSVNAAFISLAGDVSVDLVMTVFMTAAFLTFCEMREGLLSQNIGGVAVAFLLFYAVFTKMTAVYCYPFFLLLFIHDISKKKFISFWRTTILCGLVFFTLYFAAYYFMTGDAFYRFHGLESTHGSGNAVPWNYRNRPWQDLLLRVTAYPPAFFLFGLGYGVPVILGTFSIFAQRFYREAGFPRLLLTWLGVLTFCFWFGSSSVTQYNPVILVERMLLPMLIPLTVFAAYLFLPENKIKLTGRFVKIVRFVCLLFLLFALILLWQRPDKWLGLVISSVALAALIFTVKKEMQFTRPLKILFFVLLFFQILWRVFFVLPDLPFFAERAFFQKAAAENESVFVLTDARTADCFPGYFDFEIPHNVKVAALGTPVPQGFNGKIFLHENKSMQQTLRLSGEKSKNSNFGPEYCFTKITETQDFIIKEMQLCKK